MSFFRTFPLAACLLALLGAGLARAQQGAMDWLTTADGLAQNFTTGVVQDVRGFYWVGTPQGLQRYDGHTFVDYPAPEGPGVGAPGGHVVPFLVDRRGRLWMARGSDLFRLDVATGESVTVGPGDLNGVTPAEAPDGTVWVALPDRLGAVALGSDTFSVRLRSAPGEQFTALAADAAGRLWLAVQGRPSSAEPGATVSAVLRFDPATRRVHRYALPPMRGWISALTVDPGGRVWVGQPGGGLYVLEPEAGALLAVPLPLPDATVTGLAVGRDGAVWFVTNSALGRVDPGTREVTLADLGDDGPRLLEGLYRDREGVLWATSLAAGLLRYSPAPRPFVSLGRRASPPLALASDFVMALQEDGDGTLWVGTLGGGLNGVRADGGAVTTYRHDPRDARSLAHDQVWALHTDRRGRRWVGTSGGLCTPATGGFACYRPEGPSGAFTAIEEDADGALWLAISGQGVGRFDPDARRFTAAMTMDSLQGASTLRRDRHGVLWVGTLNRGLWRLDVARADPRPPDAVALVRRGSVFDIHEDAEGALWLGTDQGLARVSPDRSDVTWTPVPGGPSGTTVFAVAPDEAGRLWLGTSHGLARYDPATGALRRYGARDGVGVLEFNRKAWVRLRDGRLAFGGVEGLVAFDPAALDAEPTTAPVALTRFERTSAEGVVGEVLYGARALVLTPRDYAFAVEFVAPGFTGPLRYRYRLDGFDPDWVEAGPERRATYTNLRPGRYTLRVQHAVGDGPWSEPGEEAAVVVRPPFWQTAWFRALALALLGGLLYAAHRTRVRRLLAVERMRLRIAGDLHDDIGANLSSIALLSDLVRARADLPDAERRQLERISTSARATLDDMRDIVWSIDPDLDHFADLVAKMQDTAAALLPGVRCRFHLPEAGVPDRLSMACRRDVFLAFKEALHNVARHAHATEVEVRLVVHGDCLTLAVRDNGIGLNGNGKGKGLRSLRERAERLGGRCEVESPPGGGTTVRFEARMT